MYVKRRTICRTEQYNNLGIGIIKESRLWTRQKCFEGTPETDKAAVKEGKAEKQTDGRV